VVEIALVLRAAGPQGFADAEPQGAEMVDPGQPGGKVTSKGCDELL
jgi:hypothetical protein